MSVTSRAGRIIGATAGIATIAAAMSVGAGSAPAAAADGPPIVFHLSESIDPGDVLTIYGDGLDADADVTLPDSSSCPVVAADPAGRFLSCHVPVSAPSAAFAIDVSTSGGSTTAIVNEADPIFIDQPQAWAGQEVRVVGRDFEPSGSDAIVRLRDAGTTHAATVLKSDEYSIVFEAPGSAATGEWDVEVSNDGGATWVGLERDQRLEVVPVGQDPLGLGVAWAGDFDWTVTDAATFGAVGDGVTDDAAALQAAIDAVGVAGGGVVSLDAGTYRVSSGLDLPSGVTLVGESAAATTIVWAGTDPSDYLIGSKGAGKTDGLVGISGLRLTMTGDVHPNTFIWLGQDWGPHRESVTRTASRIFIDDIELSYPMDAPTSGNGNGVYILGDSRFLVQGSTFDGRRAIVTSYGNEYASYRDNYFRYGVGQVSMISMYGVETGNVVEGVALADADGDFRGLKVKVLSYVADNHVSGVGVPTANDGEAYLVESAGGGNEILADVSAASGTSISLTAVEAKSWDLGSIYWGDAYYAVVIDGTGLGQMRAITDWDESAQTLTVAEPWDVPLDSTSQISVTLPTSFNTLDRNTAEDTVKGATIYGDSYRTVLSRYEGTNTEGVYVHSTYVPASLRLDFSYFDRVADSTLTGIASPSDQLFLGFRMGGRDGIAPRGYIMFGGVIEDNTIVGDDALVEGARGPNGIQAFKSTTGEPGSFLGAATLVTGNHLANIATGITVDEYTDGLLLHDNTFESVDVEYSSDLDPLPIVTDPPPPAADPWSAEAVYTGGESVSVGGATYVAQWWSHGQAPGASNVGPWALVGEPTGCGTEELAAWSPSWVYTGGEVVVHQGASWRARWWTRDQEPESSPWGPWEQLGAC